MADPQDWIVYTDINMANILQELSHATILNRLRGANDDKVKNAFFSNYLTALLLLKMQNIKGLLLINDHHHSKLTAFSDSMSDVNFWGKVLFQSNLPEVKHSLYSGASEILSLERKNILDQRILQLMKVPTLSPREINWGEVIAMLVIMLYRFHVKSSYAKNIINYIYRWESLTDGDKKRAIYLCFMYLMQSDNRSKLLPIMRSINSNFMLNPQGRPKVINVTRCPTINSTTNVGVINAVNPEGICEDGEATGAGNVASSSGTAGNNAIVTPGGFSSPSKSNDNSQNDNNLSGLYKLVKKSKLQVTRKGKYMFRGSKVVKKKQKAFEVRKFKAPDYLKTNSTGE